jgi:ABC-type branched-subunit amino acid transport system substrate-binding protein
MKDAHGEVYSQGAPGELWDLLMYHQLTYGHNMDAVVGPACSGASKAAAYFAEEFQVPMISYSATSKTLSGRSPFFFRLCTPDSTKSHRVVDFMQYAKWT